MPKLFRNGYTQIELGTKADGNILYTFYLKDFNLVKKIDPHVHWFGHNTSQYFFQEYNSFTGDGGYNKVFKSDAEYYQIIEWLNEMARDYPDTVMSDISFMHNDLATQSRRVRAGMSEEDTYRNWPPDREITHREDYGLSNSRPRVYYSGSYSKDMSWR